MTFPIKKIILTELFVDRNKGLYIQKGDKENRSIKISDILEEDKLKRQEK